MAHVRRRPGGARARRAAFVAVTALAMIVSLAPASPAVVSAPQILASPVISGTPIVGGALEASTGDWTGSPVSHSYQWQRCDAALVACSAIPAATSSQYLPVPADAGYRLKAVVTASNSGGASPAASQATGVIAGQQAYLKASNTGAGDMLGQAVDVSGATIVVGSAAEDSAAVGVNGNGADETAPDSGAAYVYVRNGTGWQQQAYLKASNTDADDVFGMAVAIDGDTLVVGAPTESSSASGVNGNQADNSCGDCGAAYVFVRSGSAWTQQAYLKASNPGAGAFPGAVGDLFGQSVAISGDTIVVGAPYEDSAATGVNGDQSDNSANASGAAYVFVRSGTTWTQQAYLKRSAASSGTQFGSSVAVSGDSVIVGTPGSVGPGTADVFVRAADAWTHEALLSAPDSALGLRFGSKVSLDGEVAVVSAGAGVYNDGPETAAYVYRRAGSTWSVEAVLKESGVRGGMEADVDGDTIITNARQGAAALAYVRESGTWRRHASLLPTGTGLGFALSVALSGDTSVVGHLSDSSAATDVNGDGTDASAGNSGAAYVFLVPRFPGSLSAPSVTGTAQIGQTLMASAGSWTLPATYSYQWQRCSAEGDSCARVVGATGSQYELVQDDVGSTLRVQVTAANTAGANSATSAPTAVVATLKPVNSVLPAISGDLTLGGVVSASPGSWLYAPTYTYMWARCEGAGGTSCVAISGATSQTYTVARADVMLQLRVTVFATNSAGIASATSDPTTPIAAVVPANVYLPSVSGDPAVGYQQVAAPGGWEFFPTYTYQWQRCDSAGAGCSDLAGAMASKYTPTPSDAGSRLRVRVTGSNSAGSASAVSEPTETIAAVPSAAVLAPTATFQVSQAVGVKWSASPNAGSDVASTSVRWRRQAVGSSTWSFFSYAWTSTAQRSATLSSATPGYRYCFSARAQNVAGYVGAWSAERCTTIPLDDRSLALKTTGWTRASASGWLAGTTTYTSKRSAAAATTSSRSVRQVGVLALRCPTCGSVAVYVGATKVGTISLYRSTAARGLVLLPRFSSARTGVVRLVVVSDGKPVRLDGLALTAR